jgi:hypothetical protein
MTQTNDHHGAPEVDETAAESTNRRSLLRAAVLGGAGAAVGAVALSKTASADAEPGPLTLGETETNTSTTPTTLVHTPAAPRPEGPSSLSVAGAVPPADFPFAAQIGGYGDDDVPNGVHGSTTNAEGHGVVAASLADAPGAATDPANLPALGLVAANASHIHFTAGAVAGPTAGVHLPGELYVDADGTLWFSLPGATPTDPVRWVKLAGTTTAGAYHAINPARSYDSRKTSYAVNGVIAPNQNREISVADAHNQDSGAVTTANVVPAGATAALVNITVASPTDRNFVAVTAGNVTTYTTSLQNWDQGVTQIANSIVVPLSPTRTIRVHVGDQPGSTHVIVDVFGFYL